MLIVSLISHVAPELPQLWLLKRNAMDMVLFVRHGAFYNLFDVDADVGMRVGLALSGSRTPNMWKVSKARQHPSCVVAARLVSLLRNMRGAFPATILKSVCCACCHAVRLHQGCIPSMGIQGIGPRILGGEGGGVQTTQSLCQGWGAGAQTRPHLHPRHGN
jgi:hypothetical protein